MMWPESCVWLGGEENESFVFVFPLNFGNKAFFFSVLLMKKELSLQKKVFKFAELQEHWKELTTPQGVKECNWDRVTVA